MIQIASWGFFKKWKSNHSLTFNWIGRYEVADTGRGMQAVCPFPHWHLDKENHNQLMFLNTEVWKTDFTNCSVGLLLIYTSDPGRRCRFSLPFPWKIPGLTHLWPQVVFQHISSTIEFSWADQEIRVPSLWRRELGIRESSWSDRISKESNEFLEAQVTTVCDDKSIPYSPDFTSWNLWFDVQSV